MTQARCLEPGQTYLITRRCVGRSYLLRPDPVVNNLLLYLLSIAAERFSVQLHAFVFLSNHYHLVLSEASAEVRLPEFMGWFNRHVARLLNLELGRRESVWAQGSYNAVVLVGEEAVVDKIVYTICNPVAAGLVETPQAWGGLISSPRAIEDRPYESEHPGLYFKQDLDELASLTLVRPPCIKDQMSAKRFRKRIRDGVKERLKDIYEQRKRQGAAPFLGMAAVRALGREETPRSPEPSRARKPLVACKDKKRREEILEALRLFQSAYREAYEGWRKGQREVEFPKGTYALRRYHAARCRKGAGIFALT